MKKKLALILALALLLCGCGKPTPVPDTIPDTAPAGTPADAPATQEGEEVPAFTSPAGEETRVFFTCQNYDYDCYPGWCCSSDIRFLILSREHYDPEDIQVSLPIEAPYQSCKADHRSLWHPLDGISGEGRWHYQNSGHCGRLGGFRIPDAEHRSGEDPHPKEHESPDCGSHAADSGHQPLFKLYQKEKGEDNPWYARRVTEDGYFEDEVQVTIAYRSGDMVCVSGVNEGEWFDSGYKAIIEGSRDQTGDAP